ncbi:hypothetical protein F3N42_13130 [Marinihelvus fidelis]|uniref:Uncharacterized protein n=2 Tax=Marinihelvus fidelis TaxID=2613842 RepID=A0A5N0T5F2_9GAMM|nr:hypothetical protein F3N42_13130 [Marinihelvus fidelis]
MAWLLAAIAALAACGGEPPSPYRGALYYGNGAYLMRLGLQTGEVSVAGHLGDTVIREVSTYSGEYLLIAETNTVNRRRVPRIAWFNRRTGEKGDFYGGVRARFLAAAEVMVYDDGNSLFAVPSEDRSTNQLIMAHSGAALTAMIEAAPGLLLLETLRDGAATIHSWDGHSGELQALDALSSTCRLEGAVWIDAMERLACAPRDGDASAPWLLTDLAAEAPRPLGLPADRAFRPLAYLDDQRALVLQESRDKLLGGGARHSAWLYAIDSGELVHLADDVSLGRSVAYAEY